MQLPSSPPPPGDPAPCSNPPGSLARAARVRLGCTGVEVSRLCLGLGSSGFGHDSIQARMPKALVASFLVDGVADGVTWWDTADNYGSQAHVREALRHVAREGVQITSKVHAQTAAEADESLARLLEEMACGYVDVLLLHEVDSLQRLERSRPALETLAARRLHGKVRAVGLSTHCIDVLEAVVGDPQVEVILTNYNFAGIHMDADRRDYEQALQAAFASGQGVCAMKSLGEGALATRAEEALRHNLTRDFLHGVLVGVAAQEEVRFATRVWRDVRAGV